MRRIPLWLTLVPLVAAVGLYALLWRGWAEDFRTELVRWLPGDSLSVTGFPYRLEVEVETPRLEGDGTVALVAEAARARINRGPWQPDLTVIGAEAPRFTARVGPGISARIEGSTALTSVNWGEGRLRRLSSVVQAARVRLGTLALPISADTLELHLRERDGEAVPDTSPVQAARGQLVLSGTRLRLGQGDALTMAAEILATGAARLDDYDRWAAGGTLELTKLTLADAHGEVARVNATLAPEGRDRLRVAGTVVTACPLRLAGSAAPEYRLRVPVRLAFSGTLDAIVMTAPADLAGRPRRTKEPACPRISG
ncbi:DUF2125 domain-containing protein [Polymorphobacter sp.]|uniref:DUF2125 domain-containing protein n=1 Tax=Polymorphobacter sp. TaxID=1909290 RepID=UPI003F6F264A